MKGLGEDSMISCRSEGLFKAFGANELSNEGYDEINLNCFSAAWVNPKRLNRFIQGYGVLAFEVSRYSVAGLRVLCFFVYGFGFRV